MLCSLIDALQNDTIRTLSQSFICDIIVATNVGNGPLCCIFIFFSHPMHFFVSFMISLSTLEILNILEMKDSGVSNLD